MLLRVVGGVGHLLPAVTLFTSDLALNTSSFTPMAAALLGLIESWRSSRSPLEEFKADVEELRITMVVGWAGLVGHVMNLPVIGLTKKTVEFVNQIVRVMG